MTLLPHINIQFSAPVWRLETDSLSDTLFAEIRDSSKKKVYFAAVNLKNGEVYFNDLTTPERWLTGMEAAYDGALLIHYYQSEKGPAHKGLLAVNAFNGETLWSNFTYNFDHLSMDGPVVYDARVQPRKLYLANIRTGAVTRLYEPYIYNDLENNIRAPKQIEPGELPADLDVLPPYGNWIDYLEHNNFRIVSLHALKGGSLVQVIYIFEGLYKVYEDLLNTDIQKIQPEAFILHKNCLIYIKNKAGIKVLSL